MKEVCKYLFFYGKRVKMIRSRLVMKMLLVLSISGSISAACFRIYKGTEIAAVVAEIAPLWVDEFVQYPYLYKGTFADGIAYFSIFAKHAGAAVVGAYTDEGMLIGFVSGAPFIDCAAHFVGSYELFEHANLKPALNYYITDLIVLPEYRGHGIARRCMELLEAYAQSLGYSSISLACEAHPAGHPQKPVDYPELDGLWQKLGYAPTSLFFSFEWPTLQHDGTVAMQSHSLRYWIKNV
jgi:GNAT superfamily N-acetyltransferase